MADLLRSRGYEAIGDNDDEAYVIRNEDSFPYFLDIFASNGQRDIAIEIHGYKGHKSYNRIRHDAHRTNELKSLVTNLEVYSFHFWQLTGMDDDTIFKELQIR